MHYKASEIFCEFISIFGLVLLQQFEYTDNENARDVIEGAFMVCLILIVASNFSYVSLKAKYKKDR